MEGDLSSKFAFHQSLEIEINIASRLTIVAGTILHGQVLMVG